MAQLARPSVVRAQTDNPAYQAYQILRAVFTAAPILMGLDKFSNVLVSWDQYLAPFIPQMLGVSGHSFMLVVGVIEVVAGLTVAFRPRFGGYLVTAWLWGIILNLLLIPGYYDVALRDAGLSVGAVALARLSETFSVERE